MSNFECNDFKKNNKMYKLTLLFSKKIISLINHLDFLFKSKYILQDFYIQKMHILNEIKNKILNLEILINKKKQNKNGINNLIDDINESIIKICTCIGAKDCKSTLEIYMLNDDFLKDLSNDFKLIFDLYNDYFIPLSSNKVEIKDSETFLKKNNIIKSELPIVMKIIEYTKMNPLIEKIHGATIIFFINNKIIYINGYFNDDPFDIFKNSSIFKSKILEINETLEYLDISNTFKEKYIEQMSIKDFIILSAKDISLMVKADYDELLIYKNKSLSLLIKEFVKSNIEKQRKIILLFLISDQESQFTAHIIFDLISDKTFTNESQYLSETLFNSLHWKIQKIFKISYDTYDNNKKKLENLNISNVPYDARILAIQTNDYIKGKAMEKLKEINGSKENSIKAQQWLDGFLKIPFNIYRKELIINYFTNFQEKIDKYIESFTIKIAEYNSTKLNDKNNKIYNITIQIIDEYHSIIYKSENCYNLFIKYIEEVKNNIESEININIIKNLVTDDDDYLKTCTINNGPDENVVNDCINQLTYFKKIKNELCENNIINKNNLGIMIKKLHELETMLNINLIKADDNIDKDKYNNNFNNFILNNIDELNEFIKEWDDFKIKKKKYMVNIDKILDKCTYGQNDAKNQMKRIIGQWMNGVSKGQCFGLCGPPGVGKTTLCKNGLAKCLFNEDGESRPFVFLPLGGATNGSILEGHHYTYLGSTWGKIVDILMETKCMNPIIYIDELDKISKTEHGKEIISILTHITDQSQNKEYYDRYFSSIPIDLSQVLFIFSYNDKDNIDKILRDRIQEIDIKPLSSNEKLVISQNYIIPEILNNVGFSKNEIIFENDILIRIINEYTYEAGVRKLNEILYDIVRDINLKKITDEINVTYPININNKYVDDFLSNNARVNIKKIHNSPRIGIVNGLYATKSGLGGLTVIQVMLINSDKKFQLEKLTGSQGDVMKESMNCAMTLAWNIIPDIIKKEIMERKEGLGIHIHCPDGGTPKDGPSAGLAITLGIISRLINIPVKNDIAMTGEVDLLGDAHQIGGLHSKLTGAYTAGIKTVLIPFENNDDLNIILKKEDIENNNIINNIKLLENSNTINDNNSLNNDFNKIYFRGSMEIIIVHNIFDILKYGLVDNDLEFNKNF